MVIGLLLLLGGGAVAGAQFAPIDVTTLPELNPVFDNLPVATKAYLQARTDGYLTRVRRTRSNTSNVLSRT